MGRLIGLLSPLHSSDVHAVVSELIKGIISMAAPSPGAGLTDGLQNLPASNRFARELARRDSISTLVGYILQEFKEDTSTERPDDKHHSDQSTTPGYEFPDRHFATSSVVHSISIIIELIRKNNSDYFEPYLFHTLRNRLIQVQQQLQGTDNARETLENAMREMVDRMGVVHLAPLLDIMSERFPDFQRCLRQPRCSVSLPHTNARPVFHNCGVARTCPHNSGSSTPPDVRTVPHLRAIRGAFTLLQHVSAKSLP